MRYTEGRIIKGVGGLYFIESECGVYECGALGVFRLKKITPVIGDICEFQIADKYKKTGTITKILPRKNELIRPRVSNIDLLITVMAFAQPAADIALLDRYLVFLENIKKQCDSGFQIAVLINKHDLAKGDVNQYKEIYKNAGYEVIYLSALTTEGKQELKALLKGKVSAFAGPSGVGKSSIVNMLSGKGVMETGALSKKITRGKHTTRHVELIKLENNTYLLDTPGFSSVDISSIDKDELQFLFPEFKQYYGKCGFNDCKHLNEPNCAVKEQISKGIHKERYKSYEDISKTFL